MLFGVLWFLGYHPRHHRVEHDGNGKNFLLSLVFYENVEFCDHAVLPRNKIKA